MAYEMIIYQKGESVPDLPGEDFFHSGVFFHLCESSRYLSPYMFVMMEEGHPVGKFVAVLIRNSRLYPRSLFTACQILSLPEFFVKEEQPALLDYMLDYVCRYFSNKCFYFEFRAIWRTPMFGYKEFRKHKFFPIDKIFIQNNFRKPRDIFMQTSAPKRRQAQKGLAMGTKVSEVQSLDEIDEWFEVAHQIYSPRLMKHLPPRLFFRRFYEEVVGSGKGVMFVARYKEKIIGGMICVFSGNMMYEWYVGSASKMYIYQYPGVLLTLHALDYCQRNGYLFFNFKDAISPFHPSSIRDFKIQFGGKERNSKRWYRMRWNWLNNLLTKIYL